MKTFEELGLSREFVSMLEEAGITTPTEIQEKTIPLVLAGKDVVGGSATGSGKTLAFASGIIENLEKNGQIQSLIMTPTRELADQVAVAIKEFAKHKKLNVLPIYGGVSISDQITKLKDADVVVGTPGRIIDHLGRQTLKLEKVKYLILDEMDRMFDMGFQEDVEKILRQCPKERQTMLFSATVSNEIDHLVKKYTKDATEVSVKSHVDPTKLKQIYYDVPDGMKFSLFVHLMKQEKAKLVMVFCGTRRNVDFVTNNLNNMGIKAKAIHGGMEQKKRSKVMGEFSSTSGVNVLVCTDVAARGLDIGEVSHVYNYDLPKISADYIHRIGRTARAGKEGIAISILCSRDYENFRAILRDDKIKIQSVKTPYIERVNIIVDQQRGRGGFGNSRGRDPSRGNSRGGRFGGGNRNSNSGNRREGGNSNRGNSGGGSRFGNRNSSKPRSNNSRPRNNSNNRSNNSSGNRRRY